jgi:DNA-binding transcriptional MerR regulator
MSIGEVLGLLLEEFPDVTISKIRFLESQGLIEPERTASGYRKFFDADIERLRVILREQKENFLPLRVIRDRLETGEIDDSGAIPIPTPIPTVAAEPNVTEPNVTQLNRGLRNVRTADEIANEPAMTGPSMSGPATSDVSTQHHPAAQGRARPPATMAAVTAVPSIEPTTEPASVRSELYDASEVCELAGITAEQLDDLRSFSLVAPRGTGAAATFTGDDLAVAQAAAGFLARGIDARHLRSWRQSAEREAGLYEQRILPLLRQRNPQSREDAVTLLAELADLGAELRQALMTGLLRQHLDR